MNKNIFLLMDICYICLLKKKNFYLLTIFYLKLPPLHTIFIRTIVVLLYILFLSEDHKRFIFDLCARRGQFEEEHCRTHKQLKSHLNLFSKNLFFQTSACIFVNDRYIVKNDE